MDNKIYVYVDENNNAKLLFPKCNIKTNAYIGVNGVTNDKLEGDGKTLLGEFELGIVLSMNDEYIKITDDMYWIDDPNSRYYNQLVNVLNVEKDWNSAEHLIEYPVQYEYLIEIKSNPNNIAGKGSAIFLHCANNRSTAGCIAIDRNVMKKLLKNIDTKTRLQVSLSLRNFNFNSVLAK